MLTMATEEEQPFIELNTRFRHLTRSSLVFSSQSFSSQIVKSQTLLISPTSDGYRTTIRPVSQAITVHGELKGLFHILATELRQVAKLDFIGISQYDEATNKIRWPLTMTGGGDRGICLLVQRFVKRPSVGRCSAQRSPFIGAIPELEGIKIVENLLG